MADKPKQQRTNGKFSSPDPKYEKSERDSFSQVESELRYVNGLGDALGFNGGVGGPGTPYDTVQLSQVDTLFKNNRWYLVSNMRQLLSELYVEHGLIQTIVDVPVDDGLRGGVDIKSKQLDEEQIQELQVSLDRDDDINTVGQAIKWNRLYGGAGVLIMTDQDPEKEFDIKAIDKDSALEFRAVDMWELFWDKQNTEGYDPEIQTQEFEYYNYYAKRLHKSRVMRMKGLTAPSFIRPRLRGWGFSIIEHLVRSMNQYLKSTDLSFEVLDEFKLDVYKFKNLTNSLLSPNGDLQVKKRVQMANWNKNYQNAIVLDSEDEYDHKQLSFAGLAEVMQGIRMQIASDMRMPLTKVFGISAAGFNSGEDDIEVYNSMVESQVRNKCKYDILRVIEIKCQKIFGFVPDDLSIEFKPLRVLNAEQEENVKTQKFARLAQAKTMGEITTHEFRNACNRDNLLGISLDMDMDELNPDDPQAVDLMTKPLDANPEAAVQEPGDKKTEDTEDPGANREDSRKPMAWDTGGKAKSSTNKPKDPQAKNTKPVKEAIVNSPEFDKASYDADGGDGWINPQRVKLLVETKKDDKLWRPCVAESEKLYGKPNYAFALWMYKKEGGRL